jgi:hypothetical protein
MFLVKRRIADASEVGLFHLHFREVNDVADGCTRIRRAAHLHFDAETVAC